MAGEQCSGLASLMGAYVRGDWGADSWKRDARRCSRTCDTWHAVPLSPAAFYGQPAGFLSSLPRLLLPNRGSAGGRAGRRGSARWRARTHPPTPRRRRI